MSLLSFVSSVIYLFIMLEFKILFSVSLPHPPPPSFSLSFSLPLGVKVAQKSLQLTAVRADAAFARGQADDFQRVVEVRDGEIRALNVQCETLKSEVGIFASNILLSLNFCCFLSLSFMRAHARTHTHTHTHTSFVFL